MRRDIVVPELSESVTEATVGRWLKKVGDRLEPGEAVVELETDKVDLEVGAELSGVLSEIEQEEGETVQVGDVLGRLDTEVDEEGTDADRGTGPEKEEREEELEDDEHEPSRDEGEEEKEDEKEEDEREKREKKEREPLPKPEEPVPTPEEPTPSPDEPVPQPGDREPVEQPRAPGGARRETRERLSTRRRTIARTLLRAQKGTATLTTFNEVDMTAVMALRERYRERFEEEHGVRLGILSFFVKAAVRALRHFPRLNAELAGDELILKHYYDIGIAVDAPGGLVVPVLENADAMSFAEIERAVEDLAARARSGELSIEEIRGGTFTITNGGVFGSLFSTPILNPPQAGILGLHRIEQRPAGYQGEVVLRPMMYVALSYDHRIIDGSVAVSFLSEVKGIVESPESLLFGL